MEEKTKKLIKFILENESKIPKTFWSYFLRIQDNPNLSIARNSRLSWQEHPDGKRYETNWQNFFRKAKIKINDRQIQRRLFDYKLLINQKNITAQQILRCRNAQIRSYLLRDFGPERLVRELGGKMLHQDGTSQLLHISLGQGMEPMHLVKVQDSTTRNFYLLRVPPDVKTCKEAIAWTFGIDEDEYDPVIET